ncbi:MAG: 5-deoxy-glucuronate isomerase [Gammaproteobacteria bacterium]|jgi:5-deoxy-glucuronate isomerase|nr:5-deoxy-glucuronate isomerase [Gammaproteobacteria bacterium]
MSKLLQKPANGHQRHNITPTSAGWQYVGFAQYDLTTGEQLTCQQDGRELCVVILTGRADVTVGEQCWSAIGGRDDLFADQPPAAVYVPAGEKAEIKATQTAEVAVCSAPGTGNSGPARLIDPATMSQEVRGEGTNTRYVRNILPETEPADGLLVVEVVTPSGHWSSYPPHKHDRDASPAETLLEETYYHRLQPATGYVHQRVYTDDRSLDETLSAEDGDVVLVPRGYHPVGVPHGYTSYYLNVMAGPLREWHFYNDPDHEWMLS